MVLELIHLVPPTTYKLVCINCWLVKVSYYPIVTRSFLQFICFFIALYHISQYLVEAYETRVAETEKKKLMVPIPLDEEVKSKVRSRKRQWGASWIEQFLILFSRGFKERRHDYFSWLRITQVLSTAVILGLLWWQSDASNPKGLQDQVSG